MIYSGLVIQARAHSGRFPSKRDPSTFDQTIRPYAFQPGSVVPKPLNHFKNVVSNGAPLDYSKMYGRGRKSAQRSRFFEQLTDAIKNAQPPGQTTPNGQPPGQTSPGLPPGQQPPVQVVEPSTEFETSIEATDAYNDVREKADEQAVPDTGDSWYTRRTKAVTERLYKLFFDENTAEMATGLLAPSIIVKDNSSQYTDDDLFFTPDSGTTSNIPIKDGTAFSPVVVDKATSTGGLYPSPATESEPIFLDIPSKYVDQGNNYLTIGKRDQKILDYIKENSDKIQDEIQLDMKETRSKIEAENKNFNERLNNISDMVNSRISKSLDKMDEKLVKKFAEIDQHTSAANEQLAMDFKGYLRNLFDHYNEKYGEGFTVINQMNYENRSKFEEVALRLNEALIKLTRDTEKLKMLSADLTDVVELEKRILDLEAEKINFEKIIENKLINNDAKLDNLFTLNMETENQLQKLVAVNSVKEAAAETNLQTKAEIVARTKIRVDTRNAPLYRGSTDIILSPASGSLYSPGASEEERARLEENSKLKLGTSVETRSGKKVSKKQTKTRKKYSSDDSYEPSS